MSQIPLPDQVDLLPLPRRPAVIRPGVRVTVRGRSVKLRGLQRAPTGLLRWLAILGPGVIASAAGDDAGGIGTTSSIGAAYGYDLLWVLLLLTFALALVQELAARLGAATGRGLLDLIRERFGIGWALVAVVALVLANGGIVVTEFLGVAAAAELLGLSHLLVVPLAAGMIWALVLFGSYQRAERLFLFLALAFLAYPLAAFLAHPNWGDVARGAFVPRLSSSPDAWLLLVALVGTTITPYQQLFQQSAIVEKGVAARHYADERIDAIVGAVLGNVIWAFVIIATAATLHASGVTHVGTAQDAAQALRPVAGPYAEALFAVGLLGASLLAAGVVPLATAYSVSEAFGFAKGVGLDVRRARTFYGLFTVLILVGALGALVTSGPIISLLVGIQVLNGLLLPVVLVFLLLLARNRTLMGGLRIGGWHAGLGWAILVVVCAADVALLVSQLHV